MRSPSARKEPPLAERSRTVLQVITSLSPGGAEMRMLELIRHLADQDIRFIVYQTSSQEGPLTDGYRSAGADVRTLPFRSLRFWKDFAHEATAGKAQAFQCGVTPGGQKTPLLLPLAWVCRVPHRVARYHSDGLAKVLSRKERAIDEVGRTLINLFATAVTGVSPGALTHAWRDSWESEKRGQVLVAGVNLDSFGAAAEMPADWPVPTGARAVLHVGRGKPVKNRALAVRALASASADVHLVFAGDADSEVQELTERTASDLGVTDRVHYLGHRSDVPALLAAADALLLTSQYEGLPGVMMEAKAAGLPIVASDIPGARYVAERLPEVQLVALDAPDSAWGSAVDRAVRSERDERRAELLRGTEFDLAVAAQAYLRTWGISPREAAPG